MSRSLRSFTGSGGTIAATANTRSKRRSSVVESTTIATGANESTGTAATLTAAEATESIESTSPHPPPRKRHKRNAATSSTSYDTGTTDVAPRNMRRRKETTSVADEQQPPVATATTASTADQNSHVATDTDAPSGVASDDGTHTNAKTIGGRYRVTPDGRYFVVRGRLWRTSNPNLTANRRAQLTKELMTARRAVGVALRAKAASNSSAMRAARAAVDAAKVALGERGPVWWSDGAPDYNRRMAKNTPYAEWFANGEG